MPHLSKDVCQKHMYPLTLTLLVSMYSVSLLCAFFGLTTSLLWFSLLFPLLTMPIHFLSVNGKPFLFFVVFLPLSVLAGYLFIRSVGSVDAVILSYTEWWNTQTADSLPPHILLLLLPATLVISLLYLMQRSFVCRLITVIIESSVLMALFFTGCVTGKAAVVFCLGSFFFVVLEITLRRSFQKHADPEAVASESASAHAPAYSFQLWPVVLLCMLLLSVIPHSNTPIRWNYAKTVWNAVTSATNRAFQFIRIEILNVSSEFSLKFTGFSNSGKLGGEIFQTATDSLYVTSYKRKVDSVYLSGNSKNLYTGSSWESDLVIPDILKDYSDSYLDAAELSYAAVRSGSYKDHDNLYLDNEYSILFLDYRSSTLFSAAKTKNVQVVQPFGIGYRSNQDSFQFDRRMKQDTFYRVSFTQPNLGSDEFLELATSSSYPYDNSFSENAAEMYAFTTEYRYLPKGEELDAVFAARKEMIYDNYLALPDTVTDRLYELANSLTKDKTSDYEKMRALEAYLQTLTYTTSPDVAPEGQDLIDFFLFESPRGYCTYFATALSVLGRCIGIPTRYVQGYCTRETSHYVWTLRSNDAHAWTEAYIDGLGWIPFDATPGYSAYRYQPWHISKNATPTPSLSSLPDWWTSSKSPTVTPGPVEEPEETGTDWLIALPIILGSLLSFLIILALYILYRAFRLKHFLRHSTQKDLFYYDSAQIFILYGLLCNISKTELLFADVTLYEFTEMFIREFPEVTAGARHFCDVYSSIRYGNHSVTREHGIDLLTYKTQLMTLLAEKKGKQKLLQYRIVRLLRY